MKPSPRRLTFAVKTSLLTASLAAGTVGCKKQTVNTAPEPEPPHVNEGPTPDPEPEPIANPAPEPEPEPVEHVNTVPDEPPPE